MIVEENVQAKIMYKIDRKLLSHYLRYIYLNKRVNAAKYFTRNAQIYSIPKISLTVA